jgi:predicted metal-dependent HD superfamily phosphohydrolase
MKEASLPIFLKESKYWKKNLFSQETLEELVAIYSQPHRHYHNLKHIRQVLDCIDEVRSQAQNLTSLQLAAWFHDVVYNPSASENEENSIIYTHNLLQTLNLSIDLEKVKTIILLTKTHQYGGGDRDIQFFLDADLSILGSNPSEYQVYMAAVRCEYDWVPEQEYCRKRKTILEKFLNRKKIYKTDYFYHKLEAQARENIEKEIQILEIQQF